LTTSRPIRRFYEVKGNGDESFVEVAGEVSFECAHGFSVGFAFGGAAFEVGAGSFVVEGAAESDGVERVVGLAVPAAGEAVADRLAGGRGFWCGAVAASERRFALEARGVADDQLRGGDRSDAGLV
jgi:hypothetical protein